MHILLVLSTFGYSGNKIIFIILNESTLDFVLYFNNFITEASANIVLIKPFIYCEQFP